MAEDYVGERGGSGGTGAMFFLAADEAEISASCGGLPGEGFARLAIPHECHQPLWQERCISKNHALRRRFRRPGRTGLGRVRDVFGDWRHEVSANAISMVPRSDVPE